jgi:foldase protein PrsA
MQIKVRGLALCMLTALAFGACGELLEPAAAVVGGRKITMHEVDAALDELKESAEFKRLAAQNDEGVILRRYEQGYLAVLIRREVLRLKAEEMGVEVTDREINEQIENRKAEFPSPAAFEEALSESGLTIDSLRDFLRDREYEEELRDIVVEDVEASEDALRAEYEARIDQYEQMSASHILFKEADRVIAQGIADELQAASKRELPALFRQLSTQYSTDKIARSKGGRLGEFLPHEFEGKFVRAAQKLKVGEVSEPVKTTIGIHIIYLTGRDTLSFEEARNEFEDELTAQAQDQAWEEWLLDVYEAAEIKVNPRYGEFDIETQQITNPGAGDVPGTQDPAEAG